VYEKEGVGCCKGTNLINNFNGVDAVVISHCNQKLTKITFTHIHLIKAKGHKATNMPS